MAPPTGRSSKILDRPRRRGPANCDQEEDHHPAFPDGFLGRNAGWAEAISGCWPSLRARARRPFEAEGTTNLRCPASDAATLERVVPSREARWPAPRRIVAALWTLCAKPCPAQWRLWRESDRGAPLC